MTSANAAGSAGSHAPSSSSATAMSGTMRPCAQRMLVGAGFCASV